VQEIAAKLEQKTNVPAVKAQLELLQELQTEEYWQDITLAMIEQVRRKLRGLAQFIDKKERPIVYTILEDEMGVPKKRAANFGDTGINWKQYRKRVENYIREHKDHITIAKLHRNKPLTPQDLDELERFLFEHGDLGDKERFQQAFQDEPSLTVFIRKLIGLDRSAAVKAFSQFLDGASYNEKQMRFVERIIEHLTSNGIIDPGMLYEPPFTAEHFEGVDGVFGDSDVERLFAVVETINNNAASGQ
jgi:type I restriction enzyme R subunit